MKSISHLTIFPLAMQPERKTNRTTKSKFGIMSCKCHVKESLRYFSTLPCYNILNPYLVWLICTTVEHLLTGNIIATSHFPYIPVYQEIAYALMDITLRVPVIYTIIVALLQLMKPPIKTT